MRTNKILRLFAFFIYDAGELRSSLSLSGSFLTCFLWPAEMLFLFVLLFLDFCSSTCFPSCSQSDLHCCSHALSVAQRGIPLLLMFTIVDFNFS